MANTLRLTPFSHFVIDGTFAHSSRIFGQTLIIMALIHNINEHGDKRTVKIPLVIAFMANRTKSNYLQVYSKLFELLKGVVIVNITILHFFCRLISKWFESGIHNYHPNKGLGIILEQIILVCDREFSLSHCLAEVFSDVNVLIRNCTGIVKMNSESMNIPYSHFC